jgi:arylformamidase
MVGHDRTVIARGHVRVRYRNLYRGLYRGLYRNLHRGLHGVGTGWTQLLAAAVMFGPGYPLAVARTQRSVMAAVPIAAVAVVAIAVIAGTLAGVFAGNPSGPANDSVDQSPVPSGGDVTTQCASSEGTVVSDVAYLPAGSPLQSLDVVGRALPDGCPGAPVVVWVHGGGWRRGSKDNVSAERLAWAAANGWVHVSVDYRLTPEVTYPEHNRDVAAAVAWVHANIADHGGDPTKVALIGHSAGAAIATSVGVDPRYLAVHGLVPGDDLSCVVSLDTEGYDLMRGGSSEIYRQAFGADPTVLMDASPLSHLRPGSPRAAMLVVTRGSALRQSIATDFVQRHNATGGKATLLVANGLTHAGVNDALGRSDDVVVTPPTASFLQECFGGGVQPDR